MEADPARGHFVTAEKPRVEARIRYRAPGNAVAAAVAERPSLWK